MRKLTCLRAAGAGLVAAAAIAVPMASANAGTTFPPDPGSGCYVVMHDGQQVTMCDADPWKYVIK